ncbi:hypothetical protein SAMN05216548_10423 [Faunimonas pinastri]|uniref:Uncharacterized protein n=1 Tax=Faunimonas pinastri TaxID=1855383 RepID=A0A1H9F747_9HYPH|nr:hypothetical protein [Faunimonas pinastri]SEQ33751.1 hypothetical protein SAMN05216548_10423 [Faunimonas pinastri]
MSETQEREKISLIEMIGRLSYESEMIRERNALLATRGSLCRPDKAELFFADVLDEAVALLNKIQANAREVRAVLRRGER